MASFYSNLITKPATPDTLDKWYKAPVQLAHARSRRGVPRATVQLQASDELRMQTLKSGDHLGRLYLTSDGASVAGTVNIGLAEKGENHDGPVVDPDLFTAGGSIATAGRSEIFAAAALNEVDRYKPLWQLLGLSEDPFTEYDIIVTCVTSFTSAPSELMLESEYTAGD